MPIHQLAPDVAAKIAAGEVVERPASVVKELIENSIDAGATQIRVDLINGGLQLIRVSDNGCGIAADELPLALSRHATSKVTQIDDLEHIRTLGFRGEALASIAAVAEVVLISRPRGSGQSAQISALNGQLSSVTAAASPEGTILTVRNLFSAVPARLKFLKSRNTEVSHCLHLLEQYALAYPEIRFSVTSDGRQVFATPGDGQLSSALIEIYGLRIAEQMVSISSPPSDDTRPVVSGYVSLPTCYKSTRQHLSFFVNRRWVLSRMLNSAVEEAYRTLLLTGRHPIAVVNIQLDPALIDVNVHPAKTEIRFLKERLVYATVMRAVRQAILEEAEATPWRPGSAAPAPAAAAPRAEESAVATEPTPRHAFPRDNPWITVTEEESGARPPAQSRLWQSHVHHQEPPAIPEKERAFKPAPVDEDEELAALLAEQHEEQQPALAAQPAASAHVPDEREYRPASEREDREVVAAPHDGQMDAAARLAQAFAGEREQEQRHFPQVRVIGQLLRSYVVTESDEGMYLIDQHAAHERILLERMLAALQKRESLSQLLLTPMRVELAPSELEAIEEHLPELQRIGFELEFEDGSALVKAVPNVLMKQVNARSLQELLHDLTAPERTGYSQTWEEHALANVACKAAIKANYFLTVSEMRELIEQLAQTRAPFSCCHGRPTTVYFDASALEREFGRR